MKSAYLDCFTGVSGNMALAATLDAGVSPRWLRQTLKKVIPDFRLTSQKANRNIRFALADEGKVCFGNLLALVLRIPFNRYQFFADSEFNNF